MEVKVTVGFGLLSGHAHTCPALPQQLVSHIKAFA